MTSSDRLYWRAVLLSDCESASSESMKVCINESRMCVIILILYGLCKRLGEIMKKIYGVFRRSLNIFPRKILIY